LGCEYQVPQIQQVKPLETFNEKYYFHKDLTEQDIKNLRNKLQSPDKTVAYASGLILGRYYIKTGRIDKGASLIKSYSDPSYLTRFMKTASYIWEYDAALKTYDSKTVKKSLEKIETVKDSEDFKSILIKYCNEEQVKGSIDELYQNCILAKYTDEFKKESSVHETTENIGNKENIVPGDDVEDIDSLNVDVVNLNESPEIFQGMANRVGVDKLMININTISKAEDVKADIFVDLDKMTLAHKEKILNFGLDFSKLIDTGIAKLTERTYDVYVILYPSNLESYKEYMLNLLEDKERVFMINYSMNTLQHELKVVQERAKNKTIGALVIGEGDKHFYAISLLKLYTVENTKKIIIAADAINRDYFDDRYIEYFEGIRIFTAIPLVESEEYTAFQNEYKENTGQDATFRAVIGNDMIQYLNRYYFALKETPKGGYLSGIKEIRDDKVIREIKEYRIDRRRAKAVEIISQ